MGKKTILYLILISILEIGCMARNMFSVSQDQRDYNEEEARKAILDLQKGVLVVSVPTDHRKISLLEAVVAKHPNNKAKRKELERSKTAIEKTRKHFANYFPIYDYSEFHLVDDTLVKDYMAGLIVPSMYASPDSPIDSIVRHPDKPTFLCRANRTHDDIGIFNWDGAVIPSPFPFGSQLTVAELMDIESEELESDHLVKMLEQSLIGHAILVLDAKLDRMHERLTYVPK